MVQYRSMNGRDTRKITGIVFMSLLVVAGAVWWFLPSRNAPRQGEVFGEVTETPSLPSTLAVSGSLRELGWLTEDGTFTPIRAYAGRSVLSASHHASGAFVVAVQEGEQTLLNLFEDGAERLLLSLRTPVSQLVFSERKQYVAFSVPAAENTNDVYVLDTETQTMDRVAEQAQAFVWVSDPFGLAILSASGTVWFHLSDGHGDFGPPMLVQDGVGAMSAQGSSLMFFLRETEKSRIVTFDLVTRAMVPVASMASAPDDRVALFLSPDGKTIASFVGASDGQSGSVEVRQGETVLQKISIIPAVALWLTEKTLLLQGSDGASSRLVRFIVGSRKVDDLSLSGNIRLLE